MIRLSYDHLDRSADEGQVLFTDLEVPPLKVFHEDDGLTVGQKRAQSGRETMGAASGAFLPLPDNPSRQPESAD